MSDDVTQFLQQVEQLKGRRIEEDEARSRELEERILQERSERAARRAERARSISPQKSSPANTPPPPSKRSTQAPDRLNLASSPALDSSIARRDDRPEAIESPVTNVSTSPSKENQSPFDFESKTQSVTSPSSISSAGAKTSPLSWQRRPNSQPIDKPKSRPLSMVAAENAARTSTPAEAPSATDTTLSKDQIAQTLSSKDPSWFRQTSDRGHNSAAYRRNQVEDGDRLDMSSMRSQLPGMTPTPNSPSGQPSSHSRSRSSVTRLGSPLDLTPAQRLDPPSRGVQEPQGRSPERSPTRAEGRMSPHRPISPTKGLGGFVQSAMMKRTDSVKRWSVTSPAGLARADTVASNRSNLDRAGTNSQPNSRSRPTSMIRDGSTTPTSRPSSRHGGEGDHGYFDGAGSSATNASSQAVADPTPETKPHSSTSTRTSTTTTATSSPRDHEEKTTPPSSPSKTMDSRRWSPTKSSWLEAALNKPESPKPKPTPPPSNQPAWMVELNKAKAQKAGNLVPDVSEIARTGSVSHKHEVKIGGLMRSSPIGTTLKPSTVSTASTSGSSSVQSSTTGPRPGSATNLRSSLSKSSTAPDTTKPNPTGDDNGGDDCDDSTRQNSINDGPAPTKAKPEIAAKMDFRANLKPRQPPPNGGDNKSNANEFQNVFGNLRKAKTQNYVAPDELKDNILRGKSGLNITGGPKKTERKDEFKEAILKKKKEFEKAQLEGKSAARKSSTASEKAVPEGLAKRNELGRSSIISNRDSMSSDTTKTRSSFVSNRDSVSSEVTKVETPIPSPAPAPTPAAKPSPAPNRESVEVAPKRASFQKLPASTPATQKGPIPAVASRLSGRAGGGGGSLADRFNPALASMLARGPPPMAAANKSAEDSGASTSSGAADAPGNGPQLTHMTKNRARGPRRKAPTSAAPAPAAAAAAIVDAPASSATHSPSPITENPASAEKAVQLTDSSTKTSPPKQIVLVDSSKPVDRIQLVDSSRNNPPGQIKLVDSSHRRPSYTQPYTRRQDSVSSISNAPDQIKLVDSSAVRASFASTPTRGSYQAAPISKAGPAAQVAAPAPVPAPAPATLKKPDQPPQQEQQREDEAQPPPTSPKKLDLKRMSKFLDEASPKPDVAPRPESPSKSRSRSPTKMGDRPLPLTPKLESEPRPESGPASPTPLMSPVRSPTKQAVEVSALLDDFFGPERPKREYRADAAEILMNRPALPQVRSSGAQLFQIFGDGKKVPVPAHNERVLFEREMYLCPHNFTNAAGKKTCEVYFWAGDEVPASTVEDAQVFVGREAKAFGGKAVPIRQGKETAEFIQALGGIVITRRGSSNKYDSLAPNMLCGRRYLGHVAFDEVDFSPASLCSGFAYLMTQAGKCFLWKGKGSNVDELSCARLVGMDLTLTGELEEVDDGNEPATFWRVFDGGERPHSADHWRLKPSYDKYCARLFCSDAASKQQIIEFHPFNQADLRPTSIYILDAFFEMYIIVGAQAKSQYTSFRNALDFAQDYAILACGIEDRPFVPISTVVLEGIPRDLKSVFRKWRDADSPTIMNPPGKGTGLRRGRSLRIVPLTQALQALAE